MFYLALSFLIGILWLHVKPLALFIAAILIFIAIQKRFTFIFLMLCFAVTVLSHFYFQHHEKVQTAQFNKMQQQSEYQGIATFTQQPVKKGNQFKGFVNVRDERFKFSYYPKKEPDALGHEDQLFPLTCQIRGQFKPINDHIHSPFHLFIKSVDSHSCTVTRERQHGYLKQHQKFITDQLQETAIHFPGRIVALISGDVSQLDEQELTDVKAIGIYHLLAVSGSHVTALSAIIFTVLIGLRVPTIFNKIVLCLVLIVFGLYTDLAPSAVRSIITVLFILFLPRKWLHQGVDTLGLCFVFISLIFPHFIYDIGFQFSFLITLFILLSKPLFERTQQGWLNLLYLTFIAQLGSFMISAFHFNEIQWMGLISNLLFVPFYTFLLFPLALLRFILLHLPFPFYILDQLLNFLFFIHDQCVAICLYFVKIKWFIPELSAIWLCFVLFALLMVLYYFVKRRFVTAVFMFMIFAVIITKVPLQHTNQLTMLDVGQGDAFLFQNKAGETVMIDTGGRAIRENEVNNHSISKYQILPTFKKRGITKLDYLIITHPHADHIGELDYIMTQLHVKQLIINVDSFDPEQLAYLKHYAAQLNTQVSDFRDMPDITLTYGALKLLDATVPTSDDANLQSIITLLEIDHYHVLFMGDATKENEASLLKKYELPKIDILKVGHHGSKTSSSEAFIRAIQPDISLISSGNQTRYKLPNEEVEALLLEHQSTIINTAEVGEATLTLAHPLHIQTAR
ncbi:DNA internalization-related competence protein ComEC/Rec2 [Staphylococcus auricularis]|uniref:DNA internalization-related competence protein ComEC/Rec2 n=1 Tax=Staphylococcus auricularis TaxID=29379 RepID=UPI002DC03476|nr:DNA internalization-related competence protein ComEC/Rec2 [Staphylococcus auricularis]MEB6569282.1 DNA internalization-related competence protein ComEC/Rec2 [Staphylococcus auricularis]